MVYAREPSSQNDLLKRINFYARQNGILVGQVQRTIANVVVGQMLPESVVKGGAGLQLRFGIKASRFTKDLDVSRSKADTNQEYIDELQNSLRIGWQGFTGEIEEQTLGRAPVNVPFEYIMQPFRISLYYKNKFWLSVPLELGRDEVGSTVKPEFHLADSVKELFRAISLPNPEPVAVLAIEYQIAQKLHACTSLNSERAHDLVDLQILLSGENLNFHKTKEICIRLFNSRRAHTWPPTVVAGPNWGDLYSDAAEGLGLIENLSDAIRWANQLIQEINRSI